VKPMQPADAVFEDENDAFRYVRERLEVTLPKPLAAAVALQVEVYCGLGAPLDDWPPPADAEPDGPFNVDIGAAFLGPWTVRQQDLSDVSTIATLLLLSSVRDPGERLDPLVKLIMAAACMVWRLRQRGVSLTPLQRDVLIVMRRSGAVTFDQLAAGARSMSSEWSSQDVDVALRELSAIRLKDGTVVALVHKAEDGRWSTDARGLWEVPYGASG
jgi:hypothetical protein